MADSEVEIVIPDGVVAGMEFEVEIPSWGENGSDNASRFAAAVNDGDVIETDEDVDVVLSRIAELAASPTFSVPIVSTGPCSSAR
eukprot:COSAG03_NODE_6469_length_1056_cov_0.934169_1_plen_85_part_00